MVVGMVAAAAAEAAAEAAVVVFVVVVGNCFSYQNIQTAFGAQNVSFSMDTVVFPSGVKGPRPEVNWPSQNFNCKKELCYTFISILCLHGLATENPAFIIIIIFLGATSLLLCDNCFTDEMNEVV